MAEKARIENNRCADGYIVLKGNRPSADKWEEFPVKGTFFVDSTGDVNYYRVTAENIFGR